MAAAGQDVVRTLGHQCMGFLDNLSDFLCGGGETKRTQLALLGEYPNENGISAGFFRSGFTEPYVEKKAAIQVDGKVHSIVLSYLQRAVASSVTAGATDIDGTQDCTPCTAGTVQEYNELKTILAPVLTKAGASSEVIDKLFDDKSTLSDEEKTVLSSQTDALTTRLLKLIRTCATTSSEAPWKPLKARCLNAPKA